MSERKIPAFSSQDLRDAVSQARPVLEGFDDARNRVSADIKELEAYLDKLDLKASFRYGLGKAFAAGDDADDQYVGAMLQETGTASGRIVEEAISWAEDRNGRYRLMYEYTTWDGSVDMDVPGGPLFWDEKSAQLERRPLIETKFDVRKRLYPHLPDFVKALADDFSVKPLLEKSQRRNDEIPF